MSTQTTPIEPEYRLFDAGDIAIAAFICCPLGGAILIAVNYFRLGKAVRGVLAVLLGLIGVILSFLVKWSWPTASGSLDRLKYDAVALSFLAVMWSCNWWIAKQEQGYAINEHMLRGGQIASAWATAWIGIGTLAAVVIVAATLSYSYQYRKIVVIGTKDKVVYSGLATRTSAIEFGGFFKRSQYFRDSGTTVLLKKEIGGRTISFGVRDGVWNQAGVLSSFEEMAREAAPIVGGLPIQVELLDSKGDVEVTSTVGEIEFGGNDGVFYEGLATKADAQALGERLLSMGFFQGKGTNVILSKHDDGVTMLTFVVRDGVWDNPGKVSGFEKIVREVAPAVGGLPIDMHLVTQELQLKKNEEVEENDRP